MWPYFNVPLKDHIRQVGLYIELKKFLWPLQAWEMKWRYDICQIFVCVQLMINNNKINMLWLQSNPNVIMYIIIQLK